MKDTNIPLKDIADNLNSLSWDILNMLADKEFLTYTDIKTALGGKQEKTNKEIARLEGAMLIDSKKGSDDERVKLFTLSTYGKTVLKLRKKGD